jgi:phosphoribosyl 1,2-cyclic phosphodiesterase
MDGRGHLSNEQAIDFARSLHQADATPEFVMLLHLSEQCNHPDVVRETWLRHAPELAQRVRIAERRMPSEAVIAGPGALA